MNLPKLGCGLWKALAATAAALIFFSSMVVAADTRLSTNQQESPATDSNRLDSAKGTASAVGTRLTKDRGRLGLVISGSPDGAIVEHVVIGGPGWQAGIRSGDVITEVDARILTGMALPGIAQLLRGPVGSEINLTLMRPGKRELLKVKPKRAEVPPPGDVNAM